MKRKNLSIKEALELLAKFNLGVTEAHLRSIKNGTYLGVHQKEDGTRIRLYLQTVWIKKFTIKYSNHPDSREGKELLISNFKLPKGKVV